MMLRAIHIFPEFSNSNLIDVLRAKYDPLFNLIPPHMTLVFPFESVVTSETLREHVVESTAGFKPFEVVLTGITGAGNEYLYLNVKKGNDEIIRLHDKLYTGILRQYLNRTYTYTPHITVGRLKEKRTFDLALSDTESFHETLVTFVREIVVENIDECENSKIEFTVPLCP